MVELPLRSSLFAVIASLVASGAAYSADLAVPPLAPVADFSGWYLRGDIGFSNQRVGNLFNQNYSRFDLVTNVEKGFDADRYTGSKYELTFLLNGYADLGTWYNFAPFLGAGIGFTRNTIANFGDVNVAMGGDAHSVDASKSNFAWPLYAGVGYRVSPAMTLELSYRYIDLDDETTGTKFEYTGVTDHPLEFPPSDFAGSQAGPATQLWRLRLSTTAAASAKQRLAALNKQ
jgi:opacity protein-like surface antigen